MNRTMNCLAISAAITLLGTPAALLVQPGVPIHRSIEPDAVTWTTRLIPSGEAHRVPPPPDAAAAGAQLQLVKEFTADLDQTAVAQGRYWDARAPVLSVDGHRRMMESRREKQLQRTRWPKKLLALAFLLL